MFREIIYALLGLGALAFAIEIISAFFDDPREPPRVFSRIPLLGHAIGLLRNGTQYFAYTAEQTSAEIYTLSLVGLIKIYIINSSDLMPGIQRAAKTLSFSPFIRIAVRTLTNPTPETFERFSLEAINRFNHATRTSLTPGPYLDQQNLKMGQQAIVELDELVAAGQQREPVMLLEWSKKVAMEASSHGLFGKNHPYRDPKVQEAFWYDSYPLPVPRTSIGNAAANTV